jgi:prevent-host-death family protein
MKSVGAREANQKFSRLLGAVEAGASVTITRRGRAVARIVPVGHADEDARSAARARLRAALSGGWPMGGRKPTDDERHGR